VFSTEYPSPAMGFYWLPLAPLFILLVALYIDWDIRHMSNDIEHLEKLKYEYKKV
jgi:hypothetical protein